MASKLRPKINHRGRKPSKIKKATDAERERVALPKKKRK